MTAMTVLLLCLCLSLAVLTVPPPPLHGMVPHRRRSITGIQAKIEQDLKIVDNGDNPVTATANAKYYQELKEAITAVLEHPFFDGVTDCAPVGIYAGGDMKGHKHAFDQKDFAEAMKNTGLYEASCNVWSGPCPFPGHTCTETPSVSTATALQRSWRSP